ncbi:MAG: DUF2848 domain-containing protein [Acidimicrobiia bacterium]|nr:DUF2848 domain-containing protein [Acidimicrobiia bacterium]
MTTDSSQTQSVDLHLVDAVTGETHDVVAGRLVVAGFTGRDKSGVEGHLEELQALGVPVPDSTPAFYELDPSLLTTADVIKVDGAMTSGEVEPVMVNANGQWLLCVGSDHMDREIERSSIEMSKAACPKIISSSCVRVGALMDWDGTRIHSWLDQETTPYQAGSLAELLSLSTLLDGASETVGTLGNGAVMFLGTVPIVDGRLRASAHFAGELNIPDVGEPLSVSYRIL